MFDFFLIFDYFWFNFALKWPFFDKSPRHIASFSKIANSNSRFGEKPAVRGRLAAALKIALLMAVLIHFIGFQGYSNDFNDFYDFPPVSGDFQC